MLSHYFYQFDITLLSHPGQIFHPSELYRLIWGEDSIGQTQATKVHISNLRKKLESIFENHAKILNVLGFGYELLFHQKDRLSMIRICYYFSRFFY
ncbi:winged helix-turn-helix domain-containing protein [Lysinibacillus pakistanensis]|uniref:Winged helix-turn-helix domain-containing protein n=2 Tax=Lysinibacillus pakistanensis TaxID=759811 RepID=A0AAX3WVG3_9BACI|nr:winged helix-turn-helix domain-containing protein [Lysinibacillus pakistanensis]MDM5231263.1 winged helix-turn-helix domain-containing protein [Lysinibacillus pakistanensis]WHY46813.1 winged helix-turn-helix domain-containing protein [Lysinibacillus pakistanensis]WHY51826.1 winged helix-turn-helix domain-containing protein [Lysinibacillus pakistanensis]